ncbi:MAG: SDR family oxidoreductase [Eggerthellaceae bacterium]|nr:SDR family oxidoreductase [Eggerthellaceae bacterium]
MSVEKKLQVVLGGTSGMGLATAIELGKMGPVIVGGRNEERLNRAVAALKEAGVEGYGKQCDISDRASLDAFVEYAASKAPIGNVVNAAGVDSGSSELIWQVNVQGTINVVEAFLPYVGGSCIVNYSSITGYYYQPTQEELAIWANPNAEDFFEKSFECTTTKEVDPRMAFMGPEFLTYIASKRFVQYYTAANALRFGKKSSQIFSVAPGSFDTPMLRQNSEEAIAGIAAGTAFGRLGKPEEMANFIVKLLEPGHEYLTGVDLILDGGKHAMGTVPQYE